MAVANQKSRALSGGGSRQQPSGSADLLTPDLLIFEGKPETQTFMWELWSFESPLDCKEIQPVHPKGDQSWVFIGSTDVEAETPKSMATSCEELTHWQRPWCWEGLWAGGEGDNRGWDGWMASLTWWSWVWVNFRGWWWTGRPGLPWFMGTQLSD